MVYKWKFFHGDRLVAGIEKDLRVNMFLNRYMFVRDPENDMIRPGTALEETQIYSEMAPVHLSQHADMMLQLEDLPSYMFTRDQRDLCLRQQLHRAQCSNADATIRIRKSENS